MAPGIEGSSSDQADLIAQLALMQKTIKDQEEKLRIQNEQQKEKEEKLLKLERDKKNLEMQKKQEQEKLKKELEEQHRKELEAEKQRQEELKRLEEERHKKELEDKEREAKEREEHLAQEIKKKELERLQEQEKNQRLEKEKLAMKAKEEALKEREYRLMELENRSSTAGSVISDDIIDETNINGNRRKSSVPDSRSSSPCECFLRGFDKCVLHMRHLCDCSESCNFVREYFSDSSKLENFAMASVNSQWMAKHGQAIQAGKKAPPTPPLYENRSLIRKSPQPAINLNLIM